MSPPIGPRPEFIAVQPPERVVAAMPGMRNAAGVQACVFRLVWLHRSISVALSREQVEQMLTTFEADPPAS